MITPFLLLMLLIGATPATLFFDVPVVRAVAAVAAAAAVAMVAIDMRPGEGSHLGRLVRPWALPVAVPALWMAIQASPMPLADFAHPIWESAAAALDIPVVGAISIDPGTTLSGLGRYLSIIAIAFVATAVAIDRERATLLLIGLAVLTSVLAALLDIAGGLRIAVPGPAGVSLRALCALGVIISMVAGIYVFEQFGTLRRRIGLAKAGHAAVLVAPVLACLACGFAVTRSSPQMVFATACGVAVLALIILSRRLGVGPRPALAIGAVLLVAAMSVPLSGSHGRGDPFLRFAIAGQSPAAERMMEDSEILGSGAGTYAALRPVYSTAKDTVAYAAPTAASALVIELGRPMWAVMVVIAAAAAAALLRGALQRGRDWIYPAAGASCIVLMMVETFIDATLFDSAVVTVAAGIIGLGLAQSVSQTAE